MRSDEDYLIHYSIFFVSNTHVTVISHSQKSSVLIRALILNKELSLLILTNSWNLSLLFIDSLLN